jgi:uncharacterized repeat protein (TIGR03803 family)
VSKIALSGIASLCRSKSTYNVPARTLPCAERPIVYFRLVIRGDSMTSQIARRVLCSCVLTLVLLSAGAFASTYNVIHNFAGFPHGDQPNGGVISDSAGNLYGVTWVGGMIGTGSVYKVSPNAHGGWTETLIYSFGYTGSANPQFNLAMDAAGNLYGIGGSGFGTVFKLTPTANGQWSESEIWSFQGKSEGTPESGLTVDAAGNLYGESSTGANKCGAVYRLTPGSNGKWTDQILYSFQCGSGGSSPAGGLVFDKSGNLYGVAAEGSAKYGLVFELTQSSGVWSEQVLYAFTGGTDGAYPNGPVTLDAQGDVFGATDLGGSGTACNKGPCGVIFELTKNSSGVWTESVVFQFDSTDGAFPGGSLAIDQNGNLFGTTSGGGTHDEGTAFEVSPSSGGWNEEVLWNFAGEKDGEGPEYGVIRGTGGQIFGVTRFKGGRNGNGTVFELAADSGGTWRETTVTNFADGNGGPIVGLTGDGAGNLYGTTNSGGANGYGAVYELAPGGSGNWIVTIIYNFTTGFLSGGQGFGAYASRLIFDASGNLYGETQYGGKNFKGTVFELSPSAGGGWTYKDLYDFKGGLDGTEAQGGLIFDAAGNLYGTTKQGGSGTTCGTAGCGTAFELSPAAGNWAETILYNFQGGSDGAHPEASLVFDQSGSLFGTTVAGGTANACGGGCGSAFELSPSARGWTETVLHVFTDTKGDGALPESAMVIDSVGDLYGTTVSGGARNEECGHGCGTVFEFSPSGGGFKESVIYEFPSGGDPSGGLVFDGSGNLYGVTSGYAYELSAASGGWTETTIHTFGGIEGTDGWDPRGSLFVDEAGNLYGTTANGGTSDGGTVYAITQ